jgi:hypothetical protein
MDLRVLVIGDVVGTPGRKIVQERLPEIRTREGIDLVIANVENVAAGSGVTEPLAEKLFRAGVDAMTTGDHVYGKREGIPFLQKEPRIVRPLNYPEEAVGRGQTFVELDRFGPVAVLQIQGRVFMAPSECPFKAVDRALKVAAARTRLIFVDIHAEATSEKVALGWYLDGRVSCLYGTHTHIQTADERVLPRGTAYITDLGMTGPYESVIGRQVGPVLKKFMTNMPTPFEVATGDARLSGAIVTVDAETGLARSIRRFCIAEADAPAGAAAEREGDS